MGIQTHDWSFVVQSLLHEAIEFVAFRLQARLNIDGEVYSRIILPLCSFDHPKFSEICARSSEFIVPALSLKKPGKSI